jgi:Protein of unknown function (DUF2971)
MTDFDSTVQTSVREMPQQVFHYTSLDTMMKIVATRAVWCTAISYLNDSEERTFLLDAVAKRLPLLKRSDPSIDPTLSARPLEAEDVSNVTSFADEPFVACFAENSDSLMHWRAYCPQQNGVAIGFRSTCLQEARLDERPEAGMVVPQVSFGPVGYVDTRDTKVLDNVIYAAYEVAKKSVTAAGTRGDLDDHFQWTLDTIACGNKQKAFEVEDEFRLLLHYTRYRENNIKFRTVCSTVIPYVVMSVPSHSDDGAIFDFDKRQRWNAIESVVIGPTPNMALTKRSVTAFFALAGMTVEVIESKIPYRDW